MRKSWVYASVVVALSGQAVLGQVQSGELRVSVVDASGLPVPAAVSIVSEGSRTHRDGVASSEGLFDTRHLPYGQYRVTVEKPGLATAVQMVDVRSAVPKEVRIQLNPSASQTEVNVTEKNTLLDPDRTNVEYNVSTQQLKEQMSTVPGRSLLQLINDQPGWLFEANGVLHPRGSEYQTQFVVDGMPMEENRSPGFAPVSEANEVSEMTVLTGGFPAEYGRKLGGVVEVTTARDVKKGLHGSLQSGGGSFDTFGGGGGLDYGWAKSSLGFEAESEHTDRYLDPPVLGNFTNTGTFGDAQISGSHDFSDADRIWASVRRSESRFEVPNENVQQIAGQRQDRTTPEVSGQIAWNHVFSADALLSTRASVEDLSANLWSNPFSTPIVASQARGFRRSYLNTTLSLSKKRNEWKFGGDAFYAPVTEALAYQITDPTYFGPDTPQTFNFLDHRLDREQAVFAQDTLRLGNLTLSGGMRWDHYSFVVRDHAFSPRLGAAWYLPKAGLLLRFSYDRVFQTPGMENLLLASSAEVDQLSDQVLRLPVRPSRGNYLEAGFAKTLGTHAKLDATFYRRAFQNYADDDLFLNTGINFPISFQSAQIHGVDVKLDVPHWGKFSGFLSYSNMLGVAQLPVTGGLFLSAADAGIGADNTSFAITQDQRNTARARVRYEVSSRIWVAASAEYGSGLPVEADNPDIGALTQQYGAGIINRVNFDAGRVRPNFSLNLSAGGELWRNESSALRLQGELANVTDRLNVLDFAGLFSGTAVAEPRSGTVRLIYEF